MGLSIYPDLNNHLENLAFVINDFHLRNVVDDECRNRSMTVEAAGIKLDFSKNLVNEEILANLFKLAQHAEVEKWRDKMFRGDKINFTENRSVLHTALRNQNSDENLQVGLKEIPGQAREDKDANLSNMGIVDGVNVKLQVNEVLEKMKIFSENVRNGVWVGSTGKRITDVINIGIGGSDLGPRMVCEALNPWGLKDLKMHFVSNVDSNDLYQILDEINWETSLFVVVSKSFTTQETMVNARLAREWVVSKSGNEQSIGGHFVAVSTNLKAVEEFGINLENTFGFWDWVGGRYSVWGAVGLSVMLSLGYEKFYELLGGAYEMDVHFRNAPLEKNLPVILGLLGVWYRNFLNYSTLAVISYDQRLIYFPRYLQQLDMESNGKFVNRHGEMVDYATGPIIWGEVGTNAQHSFFQLIHQGTSVIPVDFIIAKNSVGGNEESHRILRANCLAQGRALAIGKTVEESFKQLIDKGVEEKDAKELAIYKSYIGNRPSNLVEVMQLTPWVLGSLIALYEHKVFVQGIIWQINSFDQMGVELGEGNGGVKQK